MRARFVEGNLFRHVAVMSLTSSVGLMAVFAVDLVNLIFISMLGRDELAAAIGYAGALLFFTTAIGIGASIASGALVSQAVGAGERARARETATNTVVYGVAVGIACAVAVWIWLDPLVGLLGAEGPTRALAVDYLRIVMIAQPVLMLGMCATAVLRAHGDARRAMMATVWGAVLNAVLDPILIFGLDMELAGAAWASVLSRIVIAVLAIRPILRHYGGFDRPTLAGLTADLGPVSAIAGPAMLSQLANPAGQAFVTRAMSAWGEAAVAGMAIAGRLTPVAFGILFALAGALGPIIGQNRGAGRMDRVRRAYLDSILFTGVVIIVVSALLFVLRAPLADLFSAEGLTRELVYLFCGPLALLFFFNGLIVIANATCNNMGRPFWSTVLNWGRHTAGTVPFVMLGGAWYGAHGVLIGQYLGGVVFGLVAAWVGWRAVCPRPSRAGT